MLTPIEIQSRVLKSGLGYQKKDVEDFINEICSDYEIIFKENRENKEKLKVLINTLNHYRDMEKEMQNTLALANKAAIEIKEAARNEAKIIETDALKKAEVILNDSKKQLEDHNNQILLLKSQQFDYLSKCKELISEQLVLIDSELIKVSDQ